MIRGDLNLNWMEPSSPEGKRLLDLEVEQGLECMITEPTRIQMRGSLITKSLIYVILTNHLELFENCGVHDPALSDHGLVYGFLNETVKHQKGKIVTFKSLKDFDVEKYKEDLMYAPWHVSEIFNSCDKANFMEMLLSSIVNTHMPTKNMRVRAQDVPYMTKERKGAIRAKRSTAKKVSQGTNQ